MNAARFLMIPILLALGARVIAADCATGESRFVTAMGENDPAKRIPLLEQSVAACPDPVALGHLGDARIEVGDLPGALEALRSGVAASLDPEQQIQLLTRAAWVYRVQGRIGEAVGAIGAALDRVQGPVPEWLNAERRAIDTHPERTQLSALEINRALATRAVVTRNFNPVPRLDLYIQFDLDRDQPNAQGLLQLESLAQALRVRAGNPGEAYRVIGHADRQGPDAYNLDLSERRARAIIEHLSRDNPGLAGRLAGEGRGEREPLYSGDTEEDHRLNRRVEIRVELPR